LPLLRVESGMAKVREIESVSVGEFIQRHADELKLKPVGEKVGYDRPISEYTINRPGLALSGFLTYFAPKRIQALGHCEMAYLGTLSQKEAEHQFETICRLNIPCIVIAREYSLQDNLLAIANNIGIPVFHTPLVTMDFINHATLNLQADFASEISMHGCMIDYRGTGVLITGKSGSGKSETAIGLLERGGALVADDLVHLKDLGTHPRLPRNARRRHHQCRQPLWPLSPSSSQNSRPHR